MSWSLQEYNKSLPKEAYGVPNKLINNASVIDFVILIFWSWGYLRDIKLMDQRKRWKHMQSHFNKTLYFGYMIVAVLNCNMWRRLWFLLLAI